jgi:hypothetical protein
VLVSFFDFSIASGEIVFFLITFFLIVLYGTGGIKGFP